tara:strand:- start:223 stop:438 length:216 start_codon:yes stop_codon:yes gene_type:complete
MTIEEKIIFYDKNKSCIHPVIKSDLITKPLWRKLYWTTARDSEAYKLGCLEILKNNFPELFKELIRLENNK